MGAKVRGIRRAKANLDRIIKDVRGVKSCEQSSLRCLLAVRRLRFTPRSIRRRSSIASSAKSRLTVPGVTGRVGYSASYAVFVHDPAVKQDFRRATARKEFLTKGFEDTRSQIDAVVKKELSL